MATCSLQNLTVIVSMMEFARLGRFAVCNIYVRLQFASWRQFSEKSFFHSEFRTRCENNFFGGDNTGSRGGEGERERVPDGSNLSSDEEASDDHGSEESDGASEAQSGERLYLIVVMVPTSMFWSTLSLYLYLSLSDYLYLCLWIWIR